MYGVFLPHQRTNPNESMNSMLTLQIPVCIETFNVKHTALYSSTISVQVIRYRNFISFFLSPSGIHAHQHRSPSCASVPPAPACSVNIALFSSYWPVKGFHPERHKLIIKLFQAFFYIDARSASLTHHKYQHKLQFFSLSRENFPTLSFRPLSFFSTFCEFSGSPQKLGSCVFNSNSSISDFILPVSK